MVFGKLARVSDSISPLYLKNNAIEYVSSVKYLGFVIKSDVDTFQVFLSPKILQIVLRRYFCPHCFNET